MIVNMLEKIANSLEKKGLTQEAKNIDAICNTIEKEALNMPWSKKPEPEDDDNLPPSRPANKTDYTTPKGGGQGRFVTDQNPPPHLSDVFKKHSDGKWYLQDVDRVEIEEVSPGNFKVYKITKDKGTVVPGLDVY